VTARRESGGRSRSRPEPDRRRLRTALPWRRDGGTPQPPTRPRCHRPRPGIGPARPHRVDRRPPRWSCRPRAPRPRGCRSRCGSRAPARPSPRRGPGPTTGPRPPATSPRVGQCGRMDFRQIDAHGDLLDQNGNRTSGPVPRDTTPHGLHKIQERRWIVVGPHAERRLVGQAGTRFDSKPNEGCSASSAIMWSRDDDRCRRTASEVARP
jgi:hypothetical protein